MVWYKSSFGFYAGLGVLALGLGGGLSLCGPSCNERFKIEREHSGCNEGSAIIEGQVLGNQEPETCSMIDNVLYCSSIDGKVLSIFVAQECYQSPEMPQPVGEQ